MAKATSACRARGRKPLASSQSRAIAPQISLPWVSACTIAFGPGRPESSTWTQSTPLPPSFQRAMSGACSSIGGRCRRPRRSSLRSAPTRVEDHRRQRLGHRRIRIAPVEDDVEVVPPGHHRARSPESRRRARRRARHATGRESPGSRRRPRPRPSGRAAGGRWMIGLSASRRARSSPIHSLTNERVIGSRSKMPLTGIAPLITFSGRPAASRQPPATTAPVRWPPAEWPPT